MIVSHTRENKERLPGPRGFLPHPPRPRDRGRLAPVAVPGRGANRPSLSSPRAAAGLSLYTATFELETVSS